MSMERIQDAIGELQDEYIDDIELAPAKRPISWTYWVAAAACVLVAIVIAISIQAPKADEVGESIVAEEPAIEAEAAGSEDVDVPEEAGTVEETDASEEDETPVGLVARKSEDASDEEPATSDNAEDPEASETGSDWLTDWVKSYYPEWDPYAVYEFDPDAGFTDEEIADIVKTLQEKVFTPGPTFDTSYTGYRTESTELEAVGPIPWYYLKSDGTLDPDPVECCIIFDNGEPLFLIEKSHWGRTYYNRMESGLNEFFHSLLSEGRLWNGHMTTSLKERIEAGGTEFAFISGSDETLLVDGDELYEADFVAYRDGEHPIYNTEYYHWEIDEIPFGGRPESDGSPVDLSGLVLGSINNRQTFEYQSPE